MIYLQINNGNELQEYFRRFDRDYYSIESYDAMIELFEDNNFELDVIALCCDFNESTIEELISDYDLTEDTWEEYLEDHTYYRVLDNGNVFYGVF